MNLLRNCLFVSLIALVTLPSWAQTPGAPGADEGSASDISYAMGFKVGAFLPYDIVGVRSLLPMWGARFAHSVSDVMQLEYNLDIANAKGVTYYNGYLSLRYDFAILDTLPLFGIFGGDIHHYRRINTRVTNTSFPFETVYGWHIGFGGEYLLITDLYLRGDIKMGFEPGRQLTATLGFTTHF